MSLKQTHIYQESTIEGELGVRTFYLYSQSDIEYLASDFKIIKNEVLDQHGKKWLNIILEKK